MNRMELLKKAGNMVKIEYRSENNLECLAIGWFYAMDEEVIKLKITSTAYETYENISILIGKITKIEDYQRD